MGRRLFEYHPTVGYRFVPGLRARIPHEGGGYRISVNGSGFRSMHEFVPEKGRSRRVLLFGDSYTAGDGVSNEHRYGDVLETLVPDLEVYNFGLPGTGTDQHYLAYQAFASDLSCDLVVVTVLVENIRRVASRYRYFAGPDGERQCFAKPYFEIEDGRLIARQVPVPKEPVPEEAMAPDQREKVDRGGRFPLIGRIARQTGLKDVLQRTVRYQPLPEYDRPDTPAWTTLRAILSDWIRSSAVPVLVVPLPIYHYVEEQADPSAYQARFRELAAETGCALHDPLPDLQAYAMPERRAFRFANDPHPTPQGHRAIAQSLAGSVTRLLDTVAV